MQVGRFTKTLCGHLRTLANREAPVPFAHDKLRFDVANLMPSFTSSDAGLIVHFRGLFATGWCALPGENAGFRMVH